ncbi:hypothetical protein MTO96_022804 [Rhipicephalus appendiculatus]
MQPPPHGPRLMRAKVVFGDYMRLCSKELLEVAKNTPPTKVRKVILISCHMYNTCKEATLEKMNLTEFKNTTPEELIIPIFQCVHGAGQNLSSMYYTKLKMSDNFRKTAGNSMMCAMNMWKTKPITPEAMEDSITFGLKALLAFGWN